MIYKIRSSNELNFIELVNLRQQYLNRTNFNLKLNYRKNEHKINRIK